MSKKIDENGYWYIKKNPISKEGVFPYLGSSISEDCEPDKVYKVYRSAKTLEDSVDSWDNPPKPFINDHEMLGEGFTAIDERPVQGIIYNPVCEDGVLYADIAVYSEDLKSEIENGKKELSLGYFCKYRKERGVFNGEVYDFVQEDMVGNHIALVDAGRCGADVRVFDHKCAMDSLSVGNVFEKESSALKKTNESGKIEITEQKDTVMNGVSLEDIRKVLTEAFSYGNGEVDPKVKLVMEIFAEKAKPATTDEDDAEEKKSEDEEESEKEEEKSKTEDSLSEILKVVKDMADKVEKLVSKDEKEEEKKSEDEEESEKKAEDEDKDEEKKSEDSDDDKKSDAEDEDSDEEEETKTSEDSAVFVLGMDSAVAGDQALMEYLK